MKPITKVFLVIATLVAIFIAWALFFNDNGVLETGWNAVVSPVNATWQNLTGGSEDLLPEFDVSGAGDGTGSVEDAKGAVDGGL